MQQLTSVITSPILSHIVRDTANSSFVNHKGKDVYSDLLARMSNAPFHSEFRKCFGAMCSFIIEG